jgi:hypothetical protein
VAFNPPIADNDIPSSAKWNTAVALYDRNTTFVDVNTTAALTSVYSKAISAGHMSSDRILRCTISGNWLNNTSVNRGCQVQILLGATTLWDSTNASLGATSANRMPWRIQFEIANLGATNSQHMSGYIAFVDTAGGVAAAGLGPIANGYGSIFSSNGPTAVDTASAQTLDVKIAPSASSASLSFRKYVATLELL